MSETVSKEEAKEQVVIMAERTAMLYQSFAEVMQEKLGDEKAKELILEAINMFGTLCGERVRRGVEKQNLEHSLDNYFKFPDLPKYGWDTASKKNDKDNKLEVDVFYCPLADYWLENMDPCIARLYCFVDQAKFSGYNPKLKCTHTKNMLDGDQKCTLLIEQEE